MAGREDHAKAKSPKKTGLMFILLGIGIFVIASICQGFVGSSMFSFTYETDFSPSLSGVGVELLANLTFWPGWIASVLCIIYGIASVFSADPTEESNTAKLTRIKKQDRSTAHDNIARIITLPSKKESKRESRQILLAVLAIVVLIACIVVYSIFSPKNTPTSTASSHNSNSSQPNEYEDNSSDTVSSAPQNNQVSSNPPSSTTDNRQSSPNPSSDSTTSTANTWEIGTSVSTTCYWSAGTAPQTTSSYVSIFMHCADQPSEYMFSQMVIHDTDFDLNTAMSGKRYTVKGVVQDIVNSTAGYSMPVITVGSIK